MPPKSKRRKLTKPRNEISDRLSDLSEFSSDSDGRLSGLSQFSSDSNGRLFNYSTDSDVESPSLLARSPLQQPDRSPSPPVARSPAQPPLRSPSPVAGPSGLQPDRSPSPVAGPSGLQPPVLHPAPVSPVPVPNFYEEETKVFENENFAIYIQKQDHQRQKVFRIEDHLYVLRVKLKNTKKPPLLRDVRDILERAMESMVNELRHNYKAEEKNIIYLTMKQPGMVNALRSSGFTLQLSDTDSILKFVMVMLNRFLASNEELRLDQGFRVYFKIFSYNHTKWPKRRSGSGIKRSLGCKRSEAPLNIAGVIEIKPGFLGDEAAFENKCLLWSTLICHFANEAFQSSKEGSIFEKLTHLWTKRSTQKNKKDAGKLLKQEIEKLISQLDLPVNGPYNIIETLPKLCHHFSSQIHVIRSTQEPEANVESFPSSVWDDTLPQIFLYLSEPGHVVPIINLKKYVNKNNQLCLICRKTFTPFYRHVCSFKEKSCFLCNCYYAKENTIIQKNLPFQYCFSKLDLHLPNFIVCNICNYKFPTQRCFDSHKVICGVKSKRGRIGWFCDTCNKFVKGNSSENVKKQHKCLAKNEKKCRICQEVFEKSSVAHQCKLGKEKLTERWPNLIFFSFEFTNSSSFVCTQCHSLRKLYLQSNNLTWKEASAQKEFLSIKCCRHQADSIGATATPNLCTVWRETKIGCFEELLLADDNLKINTKRGSDQIYFNYDLHDKNINWGTSKVKTARKKTEATNGQLKKIEEKENKTVLDYFTLFLMSPETKGSTLISLNPENENMASAMDCLSKLDWCPAVIKKGNNYILLKTKCQQLVFLNASNYFKGNYEDLNKQFSLEEELHFFPAK